MRALCKTWTEGSPAAFAVLDGIGDWTGDDQLCITQEGHTPFIGAWTTVTNWTNEGSPYLWWTGPDDAVILQAVVNWGLSAHLLGGTNKVGIIAGNRASDQLALNDYLLPDLRNAGITAVVKTIDSDPNDTATTDTQAPLVVQQLRSAGITSVIPLIPFNVFYPVLQAETQQQWYPQPAPERLRGEHRVRARPDPHPLREGPRRPGGSDHPDARRRDHQVELHRAPRLRRRGARPAGRRGTRPTRRSRQGDTTDYLEQQGPVVGWCQAITLFAKAARAAGSDLNRRTFVTAMSKITDFPGTSTPILSFGPDKRYGPTEYKIVKLRNNVPPSPLCQLTSQGKAQGTCWVTLTPFTPLPTG